MDFEAKIKELKNISEKISLEETGLDDAVKLYEEGSKLYEELNKVITEANQKIEVIKR